MKRWNELPTTWKHRNQGSSHKFWKYSEAMYLFRNHGIIQKMELFRNWNYSEIMELFRRNGIIQKSCNYSEEMELFRSHESIQMKLFRNHGIIQKSWNYSEVMGLFTKQGIIRVKTMELFTNTSPKLLKTRHNNTQYTLH